MLLSQLSEATGSGKARCHRAWALNGMLGHCFSKKVKSSSPQPSVELPPHPALLCSIPGSVPPFPVQSFPQQAPTSHLWGQTRICCIPDTNLKDEATTDLLCSQTWFLHHCCKSAFGWSFLRTFSAAKVSPTFLVLHLLCPPILPSQVSHVCPSHCFSMSIVLVQSHGCYCVLR